MYFLRKLKSILRKRIKLILKKRRNWISVTINQAQILQLAKPGRAILLRPTPPSESRGNIEHYYHFIFDLILPLFCLLNKTLPNVMFLVEDFGIFTDRLLQIFPECVGIADMANEHKNAHEIELIGMDPAYVFLTAKMVEAFRKDIIFRLGVNPNGQPNKILLIERLPPDEYFVLKAKIKGSGTSRRSIINHAELLSSLVSMVKNPFELHNLQLEKIPFEDQAYYFDRALVVIAQHGAGLANCIWMRRKAVVIELSDNEKTLNHFRIISRLRQLHYFRDKTNSKHATIDIKDFTSWILKKSRLKQYFQSPCSSL